jgi:hypothetical protein
MSASLAQHAARALASIRFSAADSPRPDSMADNSCTTPAISARSPESSLALLAA